MPIKDPFKAYAEPSRTSLDPERIVYTIAKLNKRIEERFPGSGLSAACASLHDIGEATRMRLDQIARPIVWLRVGSWLMAALVVAGVAAALWAFLPQLTSGFDDARIALQTLETAIQETVWLGIGLAFLITVENRVRRQRALGYIRELRAIAHIVDMHQLTKDPDKLLNPAGDTASSPERTLTLFELGRYLDYCSELLSLTSKLAALYAERFSDSVVLQAVDEVETLTTGLSGKIWQKIMILDGVAASPP